MEHPFSGPFSVTHPILSGSRDGPLAGSPGETIPSERDKVSVKRQPEKRASSFAAFSQTKECSKEIQMNFYSFEWLQYLFLQRSMVDIFSTQRFTAPCSVQLHRTISHWAAKICSHVLRRPCHKTQGPSTAQSRGKR